MILKDFLEAVDYRITEGGEYYWDCYGDRAYQLTIAIEDADSDRYADCVFDRRTLEVVSAAVTHNDKNYRWIAPAYRDAYDAEARRRGFDPGIAYDDVRFIDLEVEADILAKTGAILRGEWYDDRVQVELTLSEDEQFRLMQMAHERDITLNRLVESILQEVIDRHEPPINIEEESE